MTEKVIICGVEFEWMTFCSAPHKGFGTDCMICHGYGFWYPVDKDEYEKVLQRENIKLARENNENT